MKRSILKRKALTLLFPTMVAGCLVAQPFSYSDYQHGRLTPLRTCFDVKGYEITLKVDPSQKFIQGKNSIEFYTLRDITSLQLDFNYRMLVEKIELEGKEQAYHRDSNVLVISFDKKLKKGNLRRLTVHFSGHPPEAQNPPWDGGFVWRKDAKGKDWVGLACEGIGASCWLPCKDHLSDEADWMSMHLQVPDSLIGVSNGKLIGEMDLLNGWRQFDWKVSYPINNYNITVNIADYAHLHDQYFADNGGILNLDYYVLKGNEEEARKHFKQVPVMLKYFGQYFGEYPFWNDGYKLVETHYWGMEHQSCVSYGNNFKNNRYGFDFIIVHESGHEWFGNSVSCTDPADMWIHESFTTYLESMFVEATQGREKAREYLLEQHKNIKNKEPMIGVYDVYFHKRKDNDIYYKGSWMLNTLRHTLNNDTLWFNTLYSLSQHFKRKIISSKEIERYLSKRSGYNFEPLLKQYLYYPHLPVFEYRLIRKNDRLQLRYRLKANVKKLELPILITVSKNHFETLIVSSSWKTIDLTFSNKSDFKVNVNDVLVGVKEVTE